MADTYSKDPQDENTLVITHEAVSKKSEFTLEQLTTARDSAQGELDRWQGLLDEAIAAGVKPKP